MRPSLLLPRYHTAGPGQTGLSRVGAASTLSVFPRAKPLSLRSLYWRKDATIIISFHLKDIVERLSIKQRLIKPHLTSPRVKRRLGT